MDYDDEVTYCEKCGNKHTLGTHHCVFDEEMNNGNKMCTCCPSCQSECAMDV